MKKTLLFAFLIISNLSFSQRVSFIIKKDKTEIDNIGAVILYVEVINKSNKMITVLKPATAFNQKRRYYGVKIECDDIPSWMVEEQKMIDYSESDLLVIPAKSKAEIMINGRNNTGRLACNSKKFQIKLSYDANELIKNTETQNYNSNEVKVIKKLTRIKIESKETSIVIK